MSTRLLRTLTALCGILGLAGLGFYYSSPFWLLSEPPVGASAAQILAVATRYHNALLLDAWCQGTGALLTVVFALALVHMAEATRPLWGWMTMLAGATIVVVSLLDDTFTIAVAQASVSGHPETAAIGFDLSNVIGHAFLIAPSLYLPLGVVLLGSRLLPRVFGYLALACGVATEILGLASLFSSTTANIIGFVLLAQEIWVVAVAILLIFGAGKSSDRASQKERALPVGVSPNPPKGL